MSAIDDVDAIHAAIDMLPYKVTVGEASPICETCAGYGFVLRNTWPHPQAAACPKCRLKPQAS